MRTDATELGDARRRVEALVSELPAGGPDDHSFEHPWEIRAFALAVAAYNNRQYEWSQFQLSLIESIRKWESEGSPRDRDPWNYYEHWLTALESVLTTNGSLSDESLDERTRTVLATPPDRHDQHVHPEPVAVDPATA